MWRIFLFVISLSVVAATNNAPIVGILAQEVPPDVKNYTSYISASYVKSLEASGARVVPIAIGKSNDYYEDVLSKINGVLFPGGSVDLEMPKGYGEAGTRIYHIAQKMNDAGDFFPLLGVCLGYELLMFIASERADMMTRCKANSALPLNFSKGYDSSRLYSKAPVDVLTILMTLPVTSNHHLNCVTVDKMEQHHLDKEWSILSTNKDKGGLEFISSSEHVKYPFTGLQFHPEKNAYEWNPQQDNPHTRKAVYSARYFYDYFVNEARKSDHKFSSKDEEKDALIYNYDPFYVGKNNGYNEQVYFF